MSSTTQTPDFIHTGSVRADLLGGTTDIYPINHILENVFTLNVALGLKAQVRISESKGKYTTIISEDYNTEVKLEYGKSWEAAKVQHPQFKFVIEIVESFSSKKPLNITLKSDAPTGSGLGGSSSMGVTLYEGLCRFFKREVSKTDVIALVQNLEARQLNKGVPGYQDYHPALYGGILALSPNKNEIHVEQLYEEKLARFLESHCSLYYSNHSRFSGINNWEVFKNFFDDDGKTRTGLQQIADLSAKAYAAIKELRYSELINLMIEEGSVRSALFDKIVTKEILEFTMKCDDLITGFKMCGAGGGGCFLVFHAPNNAASIEEIGKGLGMLRLEFKVSEMDKES